MQLTKYIGNLDQDCWRECISRVFVMNWANLDGNINVKSLDLFFMMVSPLTIDFDWMYSLITW